MANHADVEKAQEAQQTIRHSGTVNFFTDPRTYYTFNPFIQVGILVALIGCLREGFLDCSVNSLFFAFFLGLSTGFATLLLQHIFVCLISFEDPPTAELLAYRNLIKVVASFWPWIVAIIYTVNSWIFLGATGDGR